MLLFGMIERSVILVVESLLLLTRIDSLSCVLSGLFSGADEPLDESGGGA